MTVWSYQYGFMVFPHYPEEYDISGYRQWPPHQYRIDPPYTPITDWHLLCMMPGWWRFIKCWIVIWGMLFHSSGNIAGISLNWLLYLCEHEQLGQVDLISVLVDLHLVCMLAIPWPFFQLNNCWQSNRTLMGSTWLSCSCSHNCTIARRMQ